VWVKRVKNRIYPHRTVFLEPPPFEFSWLKKTKRRRFQKNDFCGKQILFSTLFAHKYYALKDDTPLEGEDHVTWYRSMIGALNYYSCATRYDISCAVSRLSQFDIKPTEGSRRALYKMLQYLSCIECRVFNCRQVWR